MTIRRVLSVLDSKIFETLFTAWASRWHGPGVLAIDGKCLKGASKKDSYDALYTVSAFADRSGMVLGQHKVHDKSNEITAIPWRYPFSWNNCRSKETLSRLM